MMVFTLCAFATMLAQQATTRVEGKVTDPVTHKPVGCSMTFVSATGKKTSIKSADDGSYLAVLNEAGQHKLLFTGFNVYKAEFTVDVPASTKFQEIKRDFQVRALHTGDVLVEGRMFEKNTATISASGKSQITALKETLTKNPQMTVNVTVVPDEDRAAVAQFQAEQQFLADSADWVKAMTAYEKKYRKAKTKPEPPVPPVRVAASVADPNADLLQQRKAAIQQELKDLKHSDLRITYVIGQLPASAVYVPSPPAPVAAASKTKSKSKTDSKPKPPVLPASNHSNLIISIGQVKRLFE
ncbi:MAG: hypothetical protein K8G78_01385 [Deltaproteobacteria bacterium]|nr:hypothetical protein [Candidatus Kapabacteria bacterium]